jgi:hypothetical protein
MNPKNGAEVGHVSVESIVVTSSVNMVVQEVG